MVTRHTTDNDAPALAAGDGAGGFPVSALPPVCRDVVAEMAHTIQTPSSICAASVLTVASLATQSLADVELPAVGKIPLSLFFLSVAKTGERKSKADTTAMNVANAVEAERVASDDHAHPLVVSDMTIEGLDDLFGQGVQSLALVNDDGGEVTSSRQTSDDGKTRFLTGISKAWDAKARKVLRKRSGLTWVIGKRLTTHLMIQPILAKDLLEDTVWNEQGALPRFLVSWPESRIGSRPLTEPSSNSRAIFRAFEDRMGSLLRTENPTDPNNPDALSPPAIPLTDDARERWIAFYNEVEFQLGEDGPLGPVQGFGAKLPEQAGRLAGVFAVVEDGTSTALSQDQMERAIHVARFYLDEILRVKNAASEETTLRPVRILDDWLARWPESEVAFAELLQRGPGSLRKKADLEPVVTELVNAGRLLPLEGGAVRNGVHRRRAYRIAPSSSQADAA